MTTNTTQQLPVEVSDKIFQEAQDLLQFEPDNKASYIKGATTYATKLIECDKTNSALEETNRVLVEQLNQQKQMTQKWRDESIEQAKVINELKNLLNEALTKPATVELMEKIKKFLYGE